MVARYPLARTFGCTACSARQLAGGALGGAALWVLLGSRFAEESAERSFRLVEATSVLWSVPDSGAAWVSVLFWGALAPAAAHELLFRGWLLTSLRSLPPRGAAAAAAFLGACFHMSVSQFGPTAALGLAAGGAALAGGVGPAVAVHAAHRAAALLWAAGVQSGACEAGPPGTVATCVAALAAGAAVASFQPLRED